MTRFTSLDSIFDHVWAEITTAAEDPSHRFRTATFGTVQARGPGLRTVVLREADRDAQSLAFHSDRRAQKISDIRGHSGVAWHWWDSDTHEQLRLCGRATVHVDDAVADQMWGDQDPSSLVVHARHSPPGTPIDAPDDGLIDAVKEGTVTREDVAPGREHFAVVRTVIDRIDWLHLHPEGHYRAQFRCPPDTPQREQSWVVP